MAKTGQLSIMFRFTDRLLTIRLIFLILYTVILRLIIVIGRYFLFPATDFGLNNVKILIIMALLTIPSTFIIVLIESGFLAALVKITSSITFKKTWRIIWICTAVSVSGEAINQVILMVGSDDVLPMETVKIGLNIFFNIEQTGKLTYLIFSEMTPFALLTWYLMVKVLKIEAVPPTHAWLTAGTMLIFRAGIRVSMIMGTG